MVTINDMGIRLLYRMMKVKISEAKNISNTGRACSTVEEYTFDKTSRYENLVLVSC